MGVAEQLHVRPTVDKHGCFESAQLQVHHLVFRTLGSRRLITPPLTQRAFLKCNCEIIDVTKVTAPGYSALDIEMILGVSRTLVQMEESKAVLVLLFCNLKSICLPRNGPLKQAEQ
jgi:hypothetical protein